MVVIMAICGKKHRPLPKYIANGQTGTNIPRQGHTTVVRFAVSWILHYKKGYRFSCPQPGRHQQKSPWAGIIKLFPPGILWLVTSQLGTGKREIFLQYRLLQLEVEIESRCQLSVTSFLFLGPVLSTGLPYSIISRLIPF